MKHKIFSLVLLGLLCSIGNVWGDPITIGFTNTTTTTSKSPTTETVSGSGSDIIVEKLALSASATALSVYTTGDKAMNDGNSTSVYSTHAYKWNQNTGTSISLPSNEYVGFSFTVAEGKTFSISGISGRLASSANHVFRIVIEDSEGTALYSAADKTINRTSDNEQTISGITNVNVQNLGAGTYNVKAYLAFNSTGKYLVFTKLQVTGTISSTGPVDPEITFANGNYIVRGSALDLSTLFTSNSSGAVTYTIKNANGTGAAIDGTNFTATSTGTATVTATQAAVDGKYNAASADATITVAEETCPSGLTISGDNVYTEGDEIELTAALVAGNGEISYQWYKGGIDPSNAIEGETATTLTIASCEFADAGNYYCIASKATCDDAVSAAFAVTVNEIPTCYAFYPATSGEAPAVGDQINATSGSFGGVMVVAGLKQADDIYYDSKGLAFSGGSADISKVVLKNRIKVGTIIIAQLEAFKGNRPRGLYILAESNNTNIGLLGWETGDALVGGEIETFTYTVKAEDENLVGSNVFRLKRQNSVYLKSLIVKNGGDEYAEPIVLKADTWTTFSPSFDVNVPSGVTAHKLAYAGGESATASPISETKIKAAEGVLLKASEAGVYQFVKTTGATELDDNILKGTTERTLVSSLKTEDNFYAFDKTDSKFKLYTGEYFPANKAYFETSNALAPSAIRIEFEENGATDIKSVEEKETAVKFFDGGRILIMKNGVVYDALGRVIR